MSSETDAKRSRWIERERTLAAQAKADIESSLGIEWPAARAWLNQLESDPNAPELKPTGHRFPVASKGRLEEA